MLTAKREAFAAGLAQGLSQAEAYRRAFPSSLGWKDKSVWEKASVLANDVNVRSRVAELQAKAAEATEFTVSEHMRMLQTLRDEAMGDRQHAAAIKAEELRGKCAGFYTEKHEHTGKGGAPIAVDMSVTQFRAIAEAVAGKV
jgi:phosphoenolpyruvate-protein kinase (PTS system EI component)